MTTPQFVENTIITEWEDSISGRPNDVGEIGPDIRIVYESDEDWRSMALENFDYITIVDGGDTDVTPKGVVWDHEDVVARVDLDIRTKGRPGLDRGRYALYGERGAGDLAENESPRWGGLAGEASRCMKSVRKGGHEFDVINVDTVDDLSGNMGGRVWRTVLNVRFEKRNSPIITEPEP